MRKWYSGNCPAAMVALIVCITHNLVMALVVLWILVYCSPSGFYWSGFMGHSYSSTYRYTLAMENVMPSYWSRIWPHTPVEDVLPVWLVVYPIQLPALSHAIVCDGPSCTWTLIPPCSLGMRCADADAPGKWPSILCLSDWNPPMTYPCELPLAGSSWSWIL